MTVPNILVKVEDDVSLSWLE